MDLDFLNGSQDEPLYDMFSWNLPGYTSPHGRTKGESNLWPQNQRLNSKTRPK